MSKKYWESYFDAIKNQDWEKAIDSLNSVLKKEPGNPQVHLKIGDVFQKAGDVTNAVSAYHQSAWLLINQGFLQKALAIYKVILRLDPENAEAINKSKELMMELESSKMKPALAQFEQVVEAEAEKNSEPETGPAAEEKLEEKVEHRIEPLRMEDMLERTSYGESSMGVRPAFETEMSEKAETPEGTEGAQIPELFASLPEGERKKIESLEPQSFSAGEAIVEEGDTGDSIFIIKSGHAKVVSHILGKEIELATLSSGDVFGEVAFLTGRPRTASVIAMDALRVLECNRLLLEEMFERHPDILKKMHDFYQSHVQDTLKKVKSKIKK